MTKYYYTFRSMTAAMKAVEKLKKQGVQVLPVRSPEHLRTRGCGYCIPLTEDRYHRVSGTLRPGEYEKLYRLREGHWEELSV